MSSKNKSEEPIEIRFQFIAVYIMIFLGFIGLLLLIIDLFWLKRMLSQIIIFFPLLSISTSW